MEPVFQRLCLDTLVGGSVQSFVDLIYLACDPATQRARLPAIRDHLVESETARRRGITSTVIEHYGALADSFIAADGTRLRTSVYFLERSLDISRMTGDTASEMASLHRLGNAYEQLRDAPRAVAFHTAHRDAAKAAGIEEEVALAAAQLVRVFSKQSAEAEAQLDLPEALRLQVAAVHAAEESKAVESQAATAYTAGRQCIELGAGEDAVTYLQQNLRATLSTAALEGGECAAYLSLAAAHVATGNLDAALECLDEASGLVSAETAQEAEAAELRGTVHRMRGEVDSAVACFSRAVAVRTALLATAAAPPTAADSDGAGEAKRLTAAERDAAARNALDRARLVLATVRADAALAERVRSIAAADSLAPGHAAARKAVLALVSSREGAGAVAM